MHPDPTHNLVLQICPAQAPSIASHNSSLLRGLLFSVLAHMALGLGISYAVAIDNTPFFAQEGGGAGQWALGIVQLVSLGEKAGLGKAVEDAKTFGEETKVPVLLTPDPPLSEATPVAYEPRLKANQDPQQKTLADAQHKPKTRQTKQNPQQQTQAPAGTGAAEGQVNTRTEGAERQGVSQGVSQGTRQESGFLASGSAKDTSVAVFGGSSGPAYRHFIQPEYPAAARRKGVSGQVTLRVHIDALGKATAVQVVQSVDASLERSAIEAVTRSEFHPLMRNGAAVACWTVVPVRFQLQ